MKFKINEHDEFVLCNNEDIELHNPIDNQEIINEQGNRKMKSEFMFNGIEISKNKKCLASIKK